MTRPIVIYTGPSALDGAPIVCLTTLGSSNVKTGPMVQTWIMRADATPVETNKRASDRSVCGDCPRRHSLGGDCYVLVHNAPQSSWKAWDRTGRPDGDLTDAIARCQKDATEHGVRLGAYGDPAAVPWQVWDAFLVGLGNPRRTGYTHQWRGLLNVDYQQWTWFRLHVMASCDSLAEASFARSAGWRFFVATPTGQAPERAVECLAERDVSPRTCETCGICNGASKASAASVWIAEHGARSGAKAKRIASLTVLR